MKPICIVTGSSGLVGSESVRFFCDTGHHVIGIDNDMRKYFFGEKASTIPITRDLLSRSIDFQHLSIDIRDKPPLENIFREHGSRISCIIHCASQPSHDWAAKEPHTDFDINAGATLTLLELTRKYTPKASFIFMSTNKVYGDSPNRLPLKEMDKRYELDGAGVDEMMPLDQCMHSLFGVSKLSADLMVQEYGRYFGINTVCFRAGCVTGPNHQGAELHGFLSYLVKCVANDEPYTIYGYQGKQVRDNIHSYDLVNAFWQYHLSPTPGAVYNVGGGRENSLSVLEAFDLVNSITGRNWQKFKHIDLPRSGDHIWYISDLSRLKADYPKWTITQPIRRIVRDMICAQSPSASSAILRGGIGNQMFLVAIAYAISKRTNRRVCFLRNQFSGCRQGSHPTTYYDNFFSKMTFVDSTSLLEKATFIDEKSLMHYDIMPAVERAGSNSICFNGYFQSHEYFKEYSQEIRELFTPNGGFRAYLKRHSNVFALFPSLENSDPDLRTFIGIRRGDFITHADYHNPCGMMYYTKAIERIGCESMHYYILTDDFAWAKKNFQGDHFHFLEIDGDTHQLMAATLFKNYIISNSTFYWWGSFLSVYENVRCIAPDKWMSGLSSDYRGCYRSDMEVIPRIVEKH